VDMTWQLAQFALRVKGRIRAAAPISSPASIRSVLAIPCAATAPQGHVGQKRGHVGRKLKRHATSCSPTTLQQVVVGDNPTTNPLA
jgi:hypothetical protein